MSHPKALTDLAHRLVDNIASLYSVNGLTGYLKSLGHKATKSAVSDYMEWFEDAFFGMVQNRVTARGGQTLNFAFFVFFYEIFS